jgi:uncharacterized repeat protein (TIGR03803 family)
MDADGNLFGTASAGGEYGFGSVYEIQSGSSAITTLVSFDGQNGADPSGQLVEDSSGTFFGVTGEGGADNDGTIFELPASGGGLETLVSFQSEKFVQLALDGNGNLFGTDLTGGSSGYGSIFEIPARSFSLITLASFDGSNGAYPDSQLAIDSNGDLYGIAVGSTISQIAPPTVFELPSGSQSIEDLATLSDASFLTFFRSQAYTAGLIVDSSGNLYGTTLTGGASHSGTVFEIPAGAATANTLATFDNTAAPIGPIELDANGDIFGTTSALTFNGPQPGAVFELSPGSSTPTLLAPVRGGTFWSGGIRLGTNGLLYGVEDTAGLVYEISPTPFADVVNTIAGADNITLTQDPDHHNVDWSMNGGTPSLLPINDANGLTINGDGGNDTVTLDYSNGNPLPATLHLNGTFTIDGLQGADPLAGRTLDIGTSTVYLNYANPSNDPIFAIRQYLQTGYDGGAWTGMPSSAIDGAITSSAAQNNVSRTTGVGFADWADGQGVNAVPNTIELKYTLYGDANLDGQVNSADLQILLAGLNRTGSWDHGDFNYDGNVNSADLQALLFTLNTSLGNQVAAATLAQPAAAPYSALAPTQSGRRTLMPAVASKPSPDNKMGSPSIQSGASSRRAKRR